MARFRAIACKVVALSRPGPGGKGAVTLSYKPSPNGDVEVPDAVAEEFEPAVNALVERGALIRLAPRRR